MILSTEERFWSKVSKTDGCWLWIGRTTTSGHGVFDLLNPKRTVVASRFAWILTNGRIGDDLEVCHNCPGGDNPACVRPDHCFIGTHADNMRDARVKGMMRRGSRHHAATIDEKTVEAFIKRYAQGGITQKELSLEFGIKEKLIQRIVKGHRWKHVCPEVERPRYRSSSILNWAAVEQIRQRYISGDVSQQELAYEFKIGQMTISNIVRFKTWKTEEPSLIS